MVRAARILRWFFALLLSATGSAKLADMAGFIEVVASYQALPAAVAAPAAWTLGLFELALGLLLATGRRLVLAAWLVLILHGLYLVWLIVALARGLQIPNCGCFGVYWPRPLTGGRLVEDALLLCAALVMLYGQRATVR